MTYTQLHLILEDNIIHETKAYKLAKLNGDVYIKIKTGVQACYAMDVKLIDENFTLWMSIPYAKTQLFWYSNSLQTKALQGIRKAQKLMTHTKGL